MYRFTTPTPTSIKTYKVKKGETIEQKVERIMNNKEPLTDRTTAIYTERKEGVRPELDPRTDKWELTTESMDVVHQVHQQLRKDKNDPKPEPPKQTPPGGGENKNEGGAQSIQATDNK